MSVARMHQPLPLYRLALVLLLVFQLIALALVLYNVDTSSAAELSQLRREGLLP